MKYGNRGQAPIGENQTVKRAEIASPKADFPAAHREFIANADSIREHGLH